MKKTMLTFLVTVLCCTFALAQYSMDSDGKTLRNSSNSSCGRIDSDGKTVRNGSNSSCGSVDSDGKTIRNGSNSSVLRIDGNDIRNTSTGSVVAKMSDVTSAIRGAKNEAIYVALWWFIVKGNR